MKKAKRNHNYILGRKGALILMRRLRQDGKIEVLRGVQQQWARMRRTSPDPKIKLV